MSYSKGKNRPDNFQTPITALEPIIKYIPKEYVIWEPACGNGNIVNFFQSNGYTINGTDVKDGFDFFNNQIDCDCIITNPPYSIKDKWLERVYQLNKPFMLLLPITALEGKKRQKLYSEYGLELILMNKRINYETPSGKGSGSWFASAWFTNGFNIGSQISFEILK